MKRSGRSTGCAVPGLPDASTMRDLHAERLVLCGLMRDHARVAPGLREVGFTKADLYHDSHQRLFDVLLYVVNGGPAGPILAAAYAECALRGELCNCGARHTLAVWLAEVWDADPWMDDVAKWGDVFDLESSAHAWAALAAATKVKHLASRRAALFAAAEVIRNAISPTGGADEIDRSVGDIHGEEYG